MADLCADDPIIGRPRSYLEEAELLQAARMLALVQLP